MILTITPNSALDKILFVDDFAIGQTVRTDETADGMGGKGAVTSWALGQLGTSSLATGFCAGVTGDRMEAMLSEQGVQTEFIHVSGETRLNYVIAKRSNGAQGTITVAGYHVNQHDLVKLEHQVETLLPRARYVLCGGSLPKGMPQNWYASIIHRAQTSGATVLADVSGDYMEPTFSALPDIIKPNEHEAGTILGKCVSTLPQAAEAALELQSRGIATVIITMGNKGAAAATPEGAFIIPPLYVQAVNTAGAGDSFNAGLLMGLQAGEPWSKALLRATATATASVLTPGTGEVKKADVARLMSEARVERAS